MAAKDPRMAGLKKGQREIAEEIQNCDEITLRQVADKLKRSPNGVSQSSTPLFHRKLIEFVENQEKQSSGLDYLVRWVPSPQATSPS